MIFYTQPLCRLCTHTSKAGLIRSFCIADQSPTSASCTKTRETKQSTPKMQEYIAKANKCQHSSWLHVKLHNLMFVQHATQRECKSIAYSMAYAQFYTCVYAQATTLWYVRPVLVPIGFCKRTSSNLNLVQTSAQLYAITSSYQHLQ